MLRKDHGARTGQHARSLLAAAALGLGIASFSAPALAAGGPASSTQPSLGAPEAPVQDGEVRLRDSVAFELKAPHGAHSAHERAAAATKALTEATKQNTTEVRVKHSNSAAVVYLGDVPIVQLYEADASAAGDASLEVHAQGVAARLRQTVQAEQRRSAIANTVFSLSLVIFLGLVTLYLLRKGGEFTARAQRYLHEHPDRVPALRVQSLELIGSRALRALLGLTLSSAKWLLWLGTLYAYLVVVTSLFDATRGYTEKLTSWVLSPIAALLRRLAASIPDLVVILVTTAVVLLLLRMCGLFFRSVGRGETVVASIPQELAAPLDALTRIGIVVLALVFAAPIVIGDSAGAVGKVGTFLLMALALATTPVLCSAAVGAVLVLRGHVRFGNHLQLGRHAGAVHRLGVIDMVLLEPDGTRLRVPYLLALVVPVKLSTEPARIRVGISVDAAAAQGDVLKVLTEAVKSVGSEARAELVGLDVDGAHYVLSMPPSDNGAGAEQLLLAASHRLREAGLALGTNARARVGA